MKWSLSLRQALFTPCGFVTSSVCAWGGVGADVDRGREKAMEGKKRWCPTSARDVGRAWGGQSLGNSSPVRTSPLQVPSLPYAPHLRSSVETLWMEVAIPLDCSQGRPGSQVSPGSWGLRQAHKDADGDGDGDVRWKPRANAQGSLRPRWERSALRCPVHPSGDSSSASIASMVPRIPALSRGAFVHTES